MPFDQERYERLRMELVDRNEANIPNVYLDVLGIPTVGLGVALTARQANRTMALDENHISALADAANLNSVQRQQLDGLFQQQVAVQNRHVNERHNNLRDFLASDFGQHSQRVLGPMVNTRTTSPSGSTYSWDVFTSPTSPIQLQLTHQQSLDLFKRIAPEYEGRLNRTLRGANCPVDALSEEQRAALYSMVYQGATGKAQRTADAIGDYWRGELNQEQLRTRLRTTVHDPDFPQRSQNELEFLNHIEPRPKQNRAPQQPPPAAPGRPRGYEPDPNTNTVHARADAAHPDINTQAGLAANLAPSDRAIYECLRAGLPATISDDAVLQATADLRKAGVSDAMSINKIGMYDGAIFATSDATTGFAWSKTQVEGVQIQPESAMEQIQTQAAKVQQQQLAQEQKPTAPPMRIG